MLTLVKTDTVETASPSDLLAEGWRFEGDYYNAYDWWCTDLYAISPDGRTSYFVEFDSDIIGCASQFACSCGGKLDGTQEDFGGAVCSHIHTILNNDRTVSEYTWSRWSYIGGLSGRNAAIMWHTDKTVDVAIDHAMICECDRRKLPLLTKAVRFYTGCDVGGYDLDRRCYWWAGDDERTEYPLPADFVAVIREFDAGAPITTLPADGVGVWKLEVPECVALTMQDALRSQGVDAILPAAAA